RRRALTRGGRYTLLAGKGAGITAFALGALRKPLAAMAFLLALCSSLLPVLAVSIMAFMRYWAPYAMTAENLTLRNFRYMLFEYPQVWLSARYSLLLGVAGATICVVLAIALAWYV